MVCFLSILTPDSWLLTPVFSLIRTHEYLVIQRRAHRLL